MSKTLLIIRRELICTFSRPSYLIMAFAVPLLAILILAGVRFVRGRTENSSDASAGAQQEWEMEVEGYVDKSGLIRVIPSDLPQEHLLAYDSEVAANEALAAGHITAYYVIPSDYIENGEIIYVFPDDRSMLTDGQSWVMKWTLMVNLQGGDVDAADRIWNSVWDLQETQVTASATQQQADAGEDCSRPGTACESNELIRLIPSMMVLLFFMSFMTSSTMLFNSIGTEKENRTLEVLLLAVSPYQMLAGKTIALGITGLLQMVAWLGTSVVLFNMGGATLSLPENFTFPAELLAWGVVFFLGGFGVYASLMAGAGALVPKIKEAGAANFITMSPLFLGYVVGLLWPLAGATNNIVPVLLSLFPLTAPVVMIMRLTDGAVPLWQLLLSVGLLFVSAYYTLRAVAAIFRAQILLSGQSFSARRYFRLLLGKA